MSPSLEHLIAKFAGVTSTTDMDAELQAFCLKEVKKLVEAGLVQMDDDANLTSTDTGKTMTKFSVAFDTMKLFIDIEPMKSTEQPVCIFSQFK